MNPVNSKRKGSDFERLLAKLLEKHIDSEAKRIPGSGALGTNVNIPILLGDVRAKFPGFERDFVFEAKVGYGGSKQLTIKKEWFDKIKEEAQASYGIPAVALKFSGARQDSGIQYVIAFDFDTFVELISYVNDLVEELNGLYEKLQRIEEELERHKNNF